MIVLPAPREFLAFVGRPLHQVSRERPLPSVCYIHCVLYATSSMRSGRRIAAGGAQLCTQVPGSKMHIYTTVVVVNTRYKARSQIQIFREIKYYPNKHSLEKIKSLYIMLHQLPSTRYPGDMYVDY